MILVFAARNGSRAGILLCSLLEKAGIATILNKHLLRVPSGRLPRTGSISEALLVFRLILL
jgi:hypothetical protein